MGSEYGVPTTGDLDAMYEELKNWGRWVPRTSAARSTT
jgi:hypothetical protein